MVQQHDSAIEQATVGDTKPDRVVMLSGEGAEAKRE